MQPDAGKEEGDQQFGDAMRQVPDSGAGALGQRQARQESAHDRRDAYVDGGQRKRKQQAHGERELRFADAQAS